MAEPLGRANVVWQLRNRLKRATKRRLRYARNWLSELMGGNDGQRASRADVVAGGLQAGDLVRVRSREEIQATLNRWNCLKGCCFMEEMWKYCGTTQRVMKPVRQFLDERDYRVKKTKHMVLLEDLVCVGTVDFGPCDRSCFFFWREEWLQKIA